MFLARQETESDVALRDTALRRSLPLPVGIWRVIAWLIHRR
jgi:hypothetical protein